MTLQTFEESSTKRIDQLTAALATAIVRESGHRGELMRISVYSQLLLTIKYLIKYVDVELNRETS